jgi:hypothetical protein
MTKTIFIVSLLLLLISCEGQQNCEDPSSRNSEISQSQEKPLNSTCPAPQDPEDPSEDPGEEPPTGEVPSEAGLFDADVVLSKFDAKDEIKVRKAIEIIKKVVRTPEFRERVVNFTYNGQKRFVDSGGLSNAEVYQKLLDASEDLRPGIDHQMDLELELYYSFRSTVGYTYPGGLKIWMNTKYFDVYTPAQVAGNVFHEWTHKLGFEHDSHYSESRKSSVPYALGYLIEELGKKYE